MIHLAIRGSESSGRSPKIGSLKPPTYVEQLLGGGVPVVEKKKRKEKCPKYLLLTASTWVRNGKM